MRVYLSPSLAPAQCDRSVRAPRALRKRDRASCRRVFCTLWPTPSHRRDPASWRFNHVPPRSGQSHCVLPRSSQLSLTSAAAAAGARSLPFAAPPQRAELASNEERSVDVGHAATSTLRLASLAGPERVRCAKPVMCRRDLGGSRRRRTLPLLARLACASPLEGSRTCRQRSNVRSVSQEGADTQTHTESTLERWRGRGFSNTPRKKNYRPLLCVSSRSLSLLCSRVDSVMMKIY